MAFEMESPILEEHVQRINKRR